MSQAAPFWKRPLTALGLRKPRAKKVRPPAPFIVGVNRSGTTLLRLMLDSHPEMAIPPETHFVPEMIRHARRKNATPRRIRRTAVDHARWDDFGLEKRALLRRLRRLNRITPGKSVRTFYKMYAKQQGKPRWGDKTPRYMRAMPRIKRALPEARFIHLIRDGRDVAISQGERTREAPSITDVAERWKRRIETARRHSAVIDDYLEVRYEDLVAEPEATLRTICDFLELAYDPAMLDYHERAQGRLAEMDRDLGAGRNGPIRTASERMASHAMTTRPPSTDRCDRWRDEMSESDELAFERVAGDLLAELGYETRSATADRGSL